MTTPPDHLTLARTLSGNWKSFDDGGIPYVRRDPAVLADLPEVRALVAAERERCAKIADRYHAQAMEWVKSQPWLKDHTGETDSSRIAAAIREGRNG